MSAQGYSEDEFLALSGLQHMAFCERQWALIHLERQWQENLRTMEGRILHERVHDPSIAEKRGDVVTLRGVALSSKRLGIYGVSDVIEYHRVAGEQDGVPLPNKEGNWRPVPVEYKRGRPKRDDRDRVQLCAQALCLEEMFGVMIPVGYLYYGETRRRDKVELDESLRKRTEALAARMHQLYEGGITPPPLAKQGPCRLCSLQDLCIPRLPKGKRVADYLREVMELHG